MCVREKERDKERAKRVSFTVISSKLTKLLRGKDFH